MMDRHYDELMSHAYSHTYGLPQTGLRFFTVYGPWGRPDMSAYIFTSKILAGEPIPVFNHGDMQRDFTYIDDIVEGVVRVLDKPAKPNPLWNASTPDPGTSCAPFRIFNIGNNNPVPLMDFIAAIEKALLPMQPGDVVSTYANIDDLVEAVDYQPQTPVQEGVDRFVAWYLEHMHKTPSRMNRE